MTGDQTHPIEWRPGHLPISQHFDDPYFSIDNGLAETRHVFLAGNGLPGRFHDGFHIAELGFGTGLNLLAALHLWRQSGQAGTLQYTTFEAFPLGADQIAEAHRAFPELAALSGELAPLWQAGPGQFSHGALRFEMIAGDARATLPHWAGRADAWFLDGFSPAKNPEMWAPDLMQQVFDHTAPAGTAATYTAAGHVRRSLAKAGFTVTRAPGYGRKRHMTTCAKAAP